MRRYRYCFLFIAIIVLIDLGLNLILKEPLFSTLPWLLIVTILAACLADYFKFKSKYTLPSIFAIVFIGLPIETHHYYNLTAWVGYAGISFLYTYIFWVITTTGMMIKGDYKHSQQSK